MNQPQEPQELPVLDVEQQLNVLVQMQHMLETNSWTLPLAQSRVLDQVSQGIALLHNSIEKSVKAEEAEQ